MTVVYLAQYGETHAFPSEQRIYANRDDAESWVASELEGDIEFEQSKYNENTRTAVGTKYDNMMGSVEKKPVRNKEHDHE